MPTTRLTADPRHSAANDCQERAARARCSRLSRPTRETEAGTGSACDTRVRSSNDRSTRAINADSQGRVFPTMTAITQLLRPPRAKPVAAHGWAREAGVGR